MASLTSLHAAEHASTSFSTWIESALSSNPHLPVAAIVGGLSAWSIHSVSQLREAFTSSNLDDCSTELADIAAASACVNADVLQLALSEALAVRRRPACIPGYRAR